MAGTDEVGPSRAVDDAGHARPFRVVVVGGGFGGLEAVRALRRQPVEVTLLDRRNFHLFQPLVYQVATGMLSLGEIAAPLRRVFRDDRNVRVVLAQVSGFDLGGRRVLVDRLPHGGEPDAIAYDALVVSAGSAYSYFGHEEWRPVAPDVKSPESALEVRRRILTAFEAAEVEPDPDRRNAWLTFVVIGAGSTGVELAGQIAEMARETLRRDFRSIDPASARIVLVDKAPSVLPTFPPRLSRRAARALELLGVMPLVGRRVVSIDQDGVELVADDTADEHVPARTVLWAAGVEASPLAAELAAQSGAALDRVGRVAVGPELSLPGHPEVLVIGDMADVRADDGTSMELPGLAPVAMQQGRYVGDAVRDHRRGITPRPFRYHDKGTLATIGRAKAVARIRHLQLSGLIAWLAWLFVHLFYLIGAQNRIVVLIRWTFSYMTRDGGAQLIMGRELRTLPAAAEPPGREHAHA